MTAGLPGPAAPLRMRLSLALAVSVALHAWLVFGLHASATRQAPGHAPLLTARLFPLPAHEDTQPATTTAHTASAGDPAPVEKSAGAPPELPIESEANAQTAPAGVLELPLPSPRYYTRSELDQPPQILQQVEPESPPEAGKTEGSVVLRLLISDSGGVDDAAALRAEPQGLFEKAAVSAFSRARFSPGMLRGKPVRSQLLIEVQFRNPERVVSGRGY